MTKYNAKKAYYDGYTFDSEMEMDFYKHLKDNPNVASIKVHPKYEVLPAYNLRGTKVRAINYEADFEVTFKDGTTDVIDIKGFETADFKIKKKMFQYKYKVPLICITKAPKYLQEETGKFWVDLDTLKKARRERKKEAKKK